MSEKQTTCPECLSTYKVTVPQLTAAQGMVCCPKCEATFNALSFLTSIALNIDTSISFQKNKPENSSSNKAIQYPATIGSRVLNIFEETVENSNINLRTYLNNLAAFNPEPIGAFPPLNLAKDDNLYPNKKNSAKYYTVWSLINFSLIAVFVFQIILANPNSFNNNSIVNTAYKTACSVLKCENLIQQYNLMNLADIKLSSKNKTSTNISGYLINHNEHSLDLPLVRVTLSKDNIVVHSKTYNPREYLIPSLANIERIPQNSPFNFNIIVPIHKNSFDNYHLEIIHP